MGAPVGDNQFVVYIKVSLLDTYRTLLTTISTASHLAGKPISSAALIQEIYETADESTVHKNTDAAAENSAMCDCWSKGGGKEGQAPWSNGKGKKKASDSAAKDDDDDSVDVACTITSNNLVDDELGEVALHVTSDFRDSDEAMALAAVFPSKDILVDAGTMHHFSSDRNSFVNYVEIPPVPIQAAGGRTFSAIGCRDLRALLPMGDGEKPTLDWKGWIVDFEEGTGTLGTARLDSHIVGSVPKANNSM
ncbi:hypothetical protein B0H10DRAFT_2233687 [Mycena sp. CBHHK59/15]|nr:hypothetical protein B0H10DRAFT_2233687 [Mycena sp. CBHHK59/15]